MKRSIVVGSVVCALGAVLMPGALAGAALPQTPVSAGKLNVANAFSYYPNFSGTVGPFMFDGQLAVGRSVFRGRAIGGQVFATDYGSSGPFIPPFTLSGKTPLGGTINGRCSSYFAELPDGQAGSRLIVSCTASINGGPAGSLALTAYSPMHWPDMLVRDHWIGAYAGVDTAKTVPPVRSSGSAALIDNKVYGFEAISLNGQIVAGGQVFRGAIFGNVFGNTVSFTSNPDGFSATCTITDPDALHTVVLLSCHATVNGTGPLTISVKLVLPFQDGSGTPLDPGTTFSGYFFS